MSQPIPTLVENDPWLAPYSEAIQQRIEKLQDAIRGIQQSHQSLTDYANLHQRWGIHFDSSKQEWHIREWAPAAQAVSLVGDFNQWSPQSHPLKREADGCWQLSLPATSLKHQDKLKLRILGADGSERDRIPSTIRRAVQDPETHDYAGQVWQPERGHQWQHPLSPSPAQAPLIYEAHVGMAGEAPRLHTYREFAENTLPRIADLGYNTIQLMAVQEHPYYGSFGYHVSSFFAPCSRFGSPEDLKYLIDRAHQHGIAVLLDVVHSHAVKNIAEGLNDFDGSGNQFFHSGERGNQPQWDSKCFDYGNPTVRRFLLSNLRYWLEEFHFDGFRFDGVTSMLYHHHGTSAFDHYDRYFLDGPDEDAILYLGLATSLIREINPAAQIIAEDMSGMPGLCRPTREGGIGFTHRLAMGIPDYWIKLLKHQRDEDWKPEEIWNVMSNRRQNEANIAYAESHDQALVGDKTIAFRLMDKEMYWHMNTDDDHPIIDRGVALHKMIRLCTLVTGGEGWLNFMGNEFGHPEWLDFPRQGNDWSYHYCRRQWSLVDHPDLKYQQLNTFDASMIGLAREFKLLATPAATLLQVHNDDQILAVERAGLIFVFNFNPTRSFPGYLINAPKNGAYKIILHSDSDAHGGHRRIDPSVIAHVNAEQQLPLYLPSRTCMVLQNWSPESTPSGNLDEMR